ncbi:hypothetical protein Rhopal_004599-T1 [Rhodotorula paludigena]|uniref:Proteophosphoglycan ppg4 n=1 Tax=Rhodotorula paludigena TaxID=86838 RepID=A0AAV5GG53_9BASI|nr:hypothetical protein Rhopal_004599-T1 [Rhodotorula paludigena]
MDEDSPWGGPSDLPPIQRAASPRLSYSPPAISSVPPSSGWGDDGGGWGGAVDDYVPGTFGGGFASSSAAETGVPKVDDEAPPRSTLTSESGGWGADSHELPRFSAGLSSSFAADEPPSSGFGPSPPLPPVALPPPASPLASASDLPDEPVAPSSPAAVAAEPEDEGGGWGGASPDLPPLASLRVAAPASPTQEDSPSGWGADADELEDPDEAPPLPSMSDMFVSNKPRRDSVELAQKGEQGEDAWGSSMGWEERMRIEAEKREAERAAEAPTPAEGQEDKGVGTQAPARGQGETAEGDAAPAKSSLASIFRFRKTAEDAARSTAETVKDVGTTAAKGAATLARSASARPSAEQERPASGGDGAQDKPAARSWLSRVAAKGGDPATAALENDPNSLGAEEVEQGGSGRTESPEPQQGAIGRFLSRLKRPASAPEGSQGEQAGSARNSSEQQQPEFQVRNLDALGTGPIHSATFGRAGAHDVYDENEEEAPRSGFFGSRGKATTRVPEAPPEDDFGGLIGAFSSAPSNPTAKSTTPSSFDPFDPLSDNFGVAPPPSSRPAASLASTHARGTAPVRPASAAAALAPRAAASSASSFPSLQSPPSAPKERASSPLDDFDAFFDSVATSTGNSRAPAASSVSPPPLLSPVPRGTPAASNSTSRPAQPASSRSSLVSPPPRMMTISPPTRTSTASPASASGAPVRSSTPIMPLAPPPPPSQPLAANRLVVALDAPPAPAPTQRVASPLQAVPLAPSPVSSLGVGSAKSPSPAPAPAARSTSGPLSLDDLSFFES